jgi:uncharacterized protein (DUF1697 family)
MKPWVALLRGVNVGGAGKLPMAEFRATLADLGYEGVATYIQSGNAVFRATGTAGTIATAIGGAVAARFAFRPHVFVLAPAALEAALAANPFTAEEGAKVHLFFLDSPLPEGALDKLAPFATKGERAELRGNVLYLATPEGMGRSDYANRLQRLKAPMTARNARSATAIAALARML